MYQCQQTKQSMGMPFHAFDRRTDNKVCHGSARNRNAFNRFPQVYHIVTPQAPIITNENYEKFAINDYPNGFNAVVAVLSYTGYDMEDACIVNKASVRQRIPEMTSLLSFCHRSSAVSRTR
jgi:DNA-directed RNA polymerase I subunit RPA2